MIIFQVPLSSVDIVAILPTGNEVRVCTGSEDANDDYTADYDAAAAVATVRLTQGIRRGVGCVVTVNGTANAPPEGLVIIQKYDETDAFRRVITSGRVANDVSSSSTGDDNGPTRYRTVVRLLYVTDQPKTDFNGQMMKCVAVQAGFRKVVAKAMIEVRCKSCVSYG